MTIYILKIGEYQYKKNYKVSPDVKEIAAEYVKMIKEDAFSCHTTRPMIEIWNPEDIDYPTDTFSENNKNIGQIIKYVSKLARKIEDEEAIKN